MTIVTELKKHGALFNESTLNKVTLPLQAYRDMDNSYLGDVRTFYYTKDDKQVRSYSFTDSDQAVFKIIKFLNTRNFFSHPWCFGFYKEAGEWKGAYLGKHTELFNQIKLLVSKSTVEDLIPKGEKLNKVSFPKTITRSDLFHNYDETKDLERLFSVIHNKDEWKSKSEFFNYIKDKIYIARDASLFKASKPYLYKSKFKNDQLTLLVNTGLLDEFNNFVTVEVNLAPKNLSFLSEPFYAIIAIKLVDILSNYNLSKSPDLITMISNQEYVFSDSNIYIHDLKGITHIFKDRYTRLPEEFRELPLDQLSESLQSSIVLALKKSKIDRTYLAPFLSIKWKRISFLMPLIINGKVACAVVLGLNLNNQWVPVTLLDIPTAYSNARLIGKVNTDWLKA